MLNAPRTPGVVGVGAASHVVVCGVPRVGGGVPAVREVKEVGAAGRAGARLTADQE